MTDTVNWDCIARKPQLSIDRKLSLRRASVMMVVGDAPCVVEIGMSKCHDCFDMTLLFRGFGVGLDNFRLFREGITIFSHLLYLYKLISEASVSHEVPGCHDQHCAPPIAALRRCMRLEPRCHIPLELYTQRPVLSVNESAQLYLDDDGALFSSFLVFPTLRSSPAATMLHCPISGLTGTHEHGTVRHFDWDSVRSLPFL